MKNKKINTTLWGKKTNSGTMLYKDKAKTILFGFTNNVPDENGLIVFLDNIYELKIN